MRPHQRFCGRSLHESPRLRVHWRAQEIVRGRIANIEFNRRIESLDLHQFRPAKWPVLTWRLRCQRFFPELLHRTHWSNSKRRVRLLRQERDKREKDKWPAKTKNGNSEAATKGSHFRNLPC